MKNKFIKSTIYVICLGLIAKILSIIVKIYTTRTFGLQFMGIYSLINPLMMFIITITQLSLPLAISKLVAKNNIERRNILVSSYIISLSISLLIMISLIILSDYIAIYIFKNINTKHSIMAIGVYSPLVTLTSLYKGYLIGNNKIEITSISQIIEEIARLFFIILTHNFFISKNISYGSMGIIIGMWIGELFQMISLILGNYKFKINIKHSLNNFIYVTPSKYKTLLSLCIPITISRLITTFSFSLEPIIYTNISLKNNLPIDQITNQYGILQTYVNPILFLPSFFISSISLLLLPNLTKLYNDKKYIQCKKLFYNALSFSIIIGIISSTFIFLFNKQITNILFKTTIGINYIKILSFPYILYYLEAILNTTLHSINKEKEALLITVITSLTRIILLYILIPKYDILGIEISMLISVFIVIIFDSYLIRKYLFLNI